MIFCTILLTALSLQSLPALPAPMPTPPSSPASPETPASPAPESPGALPDIDALTRTYRRTGETAAVVRDGSALFPFGHGHAVLRCAPLRACVLQLEAGELILATSVGDSERWVLQVAPSGPAGKTPLLVVKPTACDLTTNLVVSTDRRIYELGLDSPPCRDADSGQGGAYNPHLPYTGIARFFYPDELVRRWALDEALAAKAEADRAAGVLPLTRSSNLTKLNFNYSWERDRRFPWAPAHIFDDGEHTFIVLPPDTRVDVAPALFLVGPDGSLGLLNYHFDNGTYVTDRVLDHAVLAMGSGGPKDMHRLEIVNRARRGEK